VHDRISKHGHSFLQYDSLGILQRETGFTVSWGLFSFAEHGILIIPLFQKPFSHLVWLRGFIFLPEKNSKKVRKKD